MHVGLYIFIILIPGQPFWEFEYENAQCTHTRAPNSHCELKHTAAQTSQCEADVAAVG